MNESEKPSAGPAEAAPAAAPPAAAAPPTAPAPAAAPGRPSGPPGRGGPRRDGPPPRGGFSKPRREKPSFREGAPPALALDENFGKVPNLRELDAAIEGELQAALGGLSEKDIYTDEPKKGPRPEAPPADPSGRKKGKVLAIRSPDVFVQVPGGRSQGVLPLLQFPDGPPTVGTEVDVHIEGYDHANGLLLLSRLGAAVQVDWSSVAEGMIVEARVTETNKGGLTVEVNGIRGFMPISQIDLFRVEQTEAFVNQRLRCLVTEVRPDEKNLVVSRRALLEKEREEAREKFWAEIAEGQTREGIVRSVRDFGAFVDLGGADGLLHVSQMSWERVKDPGKVVQPGMRIKVAVLSVDREKRKLSLGLRQLLENPWDAISEKFPEGTVAKGKVTRLMEFGAFVELEPGIEGLVHISELAPQRVRRVRDIVQEEQEVTVMVLNIDRENQRIALSVKAALAEPEPEPVEEVEEEAPVEVKPRVRTTPLRGGVGQSGGLGGLFGQGGATGGDATG